MQVEYVMTVHPGNKEGIRMPKNQYDELKDFILTTLDRVSEITINELIDKGHQQFGVGMGSPMGLILYHVKLDLEARGLITQERALSRTTKMVAPKIRYLKPHNSSGTVVVG